MLALSWLSRTFCMLAATTKHHAHVTHDQEQFDGSKNNRNAVYSYYSEQWTCYLSSSNKWHATLHGTGLRIW